MSDYTKFFKKQEENVPVGGADMDKLQAYTNRLDTYDPKEALKKEMEQRIVDSDKAMEIAGRGMFQDKTPEDQAFEEKHLDPYTRGMMQGGFMGGVGAVGKTAAPIVKAPFEKIKQMFQVGGKTFPAKNEAEALKVIKGMEMKGLLEANPLGHTIKKL